MRKNGKKSNKKSNRVYLDYAAMTPLDPCVAQEMNKAQKKLWANPSSLHLEGIEANEALSQARIKIASLLHCRQSEIFFTSGGTESLNIAILGMVKMAIGRLPHVITSAIEHPAVLEPIRNLVKEKKIEASFILPDERGIVKPESIKRELKENTVLVAIQHANNEIGTIQPVREISKILKNFRDEIRDKYEGLSGLTPNPYPLLLIDACQSVLYQDISLERLGADILVIDGIKMYGPRGVGVLAVKRDARISPIVFGGGQEGGLRSGTQNVIGAIGLSKALELAAAKRNEESSRLTKLRDYAIGKILREVPGVSLNGGLENRLPNNINICLSGQDSEFLTIKLDTLGFAVSAASACHTLSFENGSYVIESLAHSTSSGQVNRECASSSLRVTLGRETKKSDLDNFIATLKKILK